MLDEDEYAEISRLYVEGIRATKEFRQKWNIPLQHESVEKRFEPVRKIYEELTGLREDNENAIMHHRISLYGPPCKDCGKPLRTPQARLCGTCMTPVEPS